MRISTLTGHLTAREKQVIVYMLQNDLTAAKSARISFWLSVADNVYTVKTSQNQDNGYGRMVDRIYTAEFTVT